MVNARAIFGLIASSTAFALAQRPIQEPFHWHVAAPTTRKSIAIVGGGAAGQAVLKTFLDLPEDTRRDWEIVLFERRGHIGGVWWVYII